MFLKLAAFSLGMAALFGGLLYFGIIPSGTMSALAALLFELFTVVGTVCMFLEAFPEKPRRRPSH